MHSYLWVRFLSIVLELEARLLTELLVDEVEASESVEADLMPLRMRRVVPITCECAPVTEEEDACMSAFRFKSSSQV